MSRSNDEDDFCRYFLCDEVIATKPGSTTVDFLVISLVAHCRLRRR